MKPSGLLSALYHLASFFGEGEASGGFGNLVCSK